MSNVISSPAALSHQYDSLVSKLKQICRDADTSRAPAIAIVSYESGAGVSSVTDALTDRMNAAPRALRLADVTISLAPNAVSSPAESLTQFMAQIFEQHSSVLQSVLAVSQENTDSPLRDRPGATTSFEQCLAAARHSFRCILIECHPSKLNSDISTLAPLVDGVLIVVEANKTTRSQIHRLANSIQTSGGTVLGYVLNKQTFPIPPSIYQVCEKAGVI